MFAGEPLALWQPGSTRARLVDDGHAVQHGGEFGQHGCRSLLLPLDAQGALSYFHWPDLRDEDGFAVQAVQDGKRLFAAGLTGQSQPAQRDRGIEHELHSRTPLTAYHHVASSVYGMPGNRFSSSIAL